MLLLLLVLLVLLSLLLLFLSDMWAKLVAAGLDPSRPVFWLLEGLLGEWGAGHVQP